MKKKQWANSSIEGMDGAIMALIVCRASLRSKKIFNHDDNLGMGYKFLVRSDTYLDYNGHGFSM